MAPSVPDRIDCLILDLFGVVVAFDDSLVYDRIAQRCSDPSHAFGCMRDLVSDPSLIRGQLQLEELHARLRNDLGLISSFQEFKELWSASYSEPMPGVRGLLQQLREQCRLVLLSNIDKDYWPIVLASVPELHGFHAWVLSFEQGVAKPQPEAFRRALAVAGVGADRCYFIDDKQENVQAAGSIGLAGHVFRSTRQLKAVLRQAGLHVAS